MPPLRLDFHAHSCRSDGTLTPSELARRAAARHLHAWALSDHDDVDGLDEAARASAEAGLAFVPAVEISVSWAGSTIHIVGLGIDPANAALQRGLAGLRAGRQPRAQAMALGLERAGWPGALAGATRHVRNPELVSRTHFARWLVEQDAAPDIATVFRHFLSPGKPGYVDHPWARLDEALDWIEGAGGLAVLAHPGRYRLSTGDQAALDATLAAGPRPRGIEVVTPAHDADRRQQAAHRARRHRLLASMGSDFHDPRESAADLGELAPLPADLAPVWHDPRVRRWLPGLPLDAAAPPPLREATTDGSLTPAA